MIDEMYGYKEGVGEKKDLVEMNDRERVGEMFRDIGYKKSDNEFMCEGLKKVLKGEGFDD